MDSEELWNKSFKKIGEFSILHKNRFKSIKNQFKLKKMSFKLILNQFKSILSIFIHQNPFHLNAAENEFNNGETARLPSGSFVANLIKKLKKKFVNLFSELGVVKNLIKIRQNYRRVFVILTHFFIEIGKISW